MGEMTLIEAIRDLGSLDDQSTIYAAEPWDRMSKVIVAREPETGGLPTEADGLGLKYFLEVSVAETLIGGWASNLGREPSVEEKCERLIHYAVNDA